MGVSTVQVVCEAVFASVCGYAGAIALGYANIYVTAPSPENLRTLFEFVFKGLDACNYQVLWLLLLP